jgi:hypothetical protein
MIGKDYDSVEVFQYFLKAKTGIYQNAIGV